MEDVGGIVVGFPLQMNGREGKACHSVKEFVTSMQKHDRLAELPVVLWDERWLLHTLGPFTVAVSVFREASFLTRYFRRQIEHSGGDSYAPECQREQIPSQAR